MSATGVGGSFIIPGLPRTVSTNEPFGIGNNAANVGARVVGLIPMPAISRPSTFIPLPMNQASSTIIPVGRGMYNYPDHSLFGQDRVGQDRGTTVINNFFILTKPDLNLSQIQGQEQKKEESSISTIIDQSLNVGEVSKQEPAPAPEKAPADVPASMPEIPIYSVEGNGDQAPQKIGEIAPAQIESSVPEAGKTPEPQKAPNEEMAAVYEPGKPIRELNADELKGFQNNLDPSAQNNSAVSSQGNEAKPAEPGLADQTTPAPSAEQPVPAPSVEQPQPEITQNVAAGPAAKENEPAVSPETTPEVQIPPVSVNANNQQATATA